MRYYKEEWWLGKIYEDLTTRPSPSYYGGLAAEWGSISCDRTLCGITWIGMVLDMEWHCVPSSKTVVRGHPKSQNPGEASSVCRPKVPVDNVL